MGLQQKHNPIERCWAVLENYWNGAILSDVETAINWASNMTWKGNHPQVNLVKEVYEKGVKVNSSELEKFQEFWQPGDVLSQWDITIFPPPE